MNLQEQQMLDDFLSRLAAVHGVAKDPQIDELIHQRLAAQPDAQYLLVQRTLLLERALENAHQQIEQLQAQATAATPRDPGGASFLNGGLEPGFGRTPTAPGLVPFTPLQQEKPPQPLQPPFQPQAQSQPAGWRERWFGGAAGAAQPAPAPTPASNGSSFLGTAAASAAGVAGGMFLFNGLGNLLGSHHGSSFLGGGNSPTVTPAVTENITQNFYDDAGRASAHNDQLFSGNNFDDTGVANSGNDNIWDDMTSGLNDGFLDNDLTT